MDIGTTKEKDTARNHRDERSDASKIPNPIKEEAGLACSVVLAKRLDF